MKVCLAAVQMDCELGKVNDNLDKAEKLIDSAKNSIIRGATLLCLPELFSTGYKLEEDFIRIAEDIPGKTSSRLSDIARNYEIHIVGGVAEKAMNQTSSITPR